MAYLFSFLLWIGFAGSEIEPLVQTGIYPISAQPTAIDRYVAKDACTYYLHPQPIVGLEHFVSAGMKRAEEGSYGLLLHFDEAGAAFMAEASTSAVGTKWGIVVHDSLFAVATVYSPITGGELMLTSGSYTRADLKPVVKQINADIATLIH